MKKFKGLFLCILVLGLLFVSKVKLMEVEWVRSNDFHKAMSDNEIIPWSDVQFDLYSAGKKNNLTIEKINETQIYVNREDRAKAVMLYLGKDYAGKKVAIENTSHNTFNKIDHFYNFLKILAGVVGFLIFVALIPSTRFNNLDNTFGIPLKTGIAVLSFFSIMTTQTEKDLRVSYMEISTETIIIENPELNPETLKPEWVKSTHPATFELKTFSPFANQ